MPPDSLPPPSFEDVIAEHEAFIHDRVSRQIPDRDRALDITQETFVTAYKTYPDLQGEPDVRTWLCRIALSHCKDYLRRQWRDEEGEA
ncbi:MAG: RNA polymerase sigma factor [Actinomycetota bacterium]